MKKIYSKSVKLFCLVMAISFFSALDAEAQYTITEKKKVNSRIDTVAVLNSKDISLDINTPAYQYYLRKQQRQERNYIGTTNTLYLSQTSSDNWSGGDDKIFTGRISTYTQHVYQAEKFVVATYINASYGIGKTNDVSTKSSDVLQVNSDVSYVLYNRWNYTFGINLSTQFSKTYTDNSVRTTYSSTFFAPATITPYLGISYKIDDTKKITLSPLSGTVLMVLDDSLSNAGASGITPGDKTKLSVGAYLTCQWTLNVTKDGKVTYKTLLKSFWDYNSPANLTWENWVSVKVFNNFTLGLYFYAIYDESINITRTNSEGVSVSTGSHLQLKETVEFGFTYTFATKSAKPTYTIVK